MHTHALASCYHILARKLMSVGEFKRATRNDGCAAKEEGSADGDTNNKSAVFHC
jgi:hypothetical protein